MALNGSQKQVYLATFHETNTTEFHLNTDQQYFKWNQHFKWTYDNRFFFLGLV